MVGSIVLSSVYAVFDCEWPYIHCIYSFHLLCGCLQGVQCQHRRYMDAKTNGQQSALLEDEDIHLGTAIHGTQSTNTSLYKPNTIPERSDKKPSRPFVQQKVRNTLVQAVVLTILLAFSPFLRFAALVFETYRLRAEWKSNRGVVRPVAGLGKMPFAKSKLKIRKTSHRLVIW